MEYEITCNNLKTSIGLWIWTSQSLREQIKKEQSESLVKAILFRHLLRLSPDRDLSRKLQFSELRKANGNGFKFVQPN